MHAESKILNVTLSKKKIHFVPNIVYAQVPTFDSPNKILQLDLLQPQSDRPLPTVVFATGGAFVAADRARMPQIRFRLAECGYVVASITYRTFPNSQLPAPIEDVKSAVRFLKAHSKKFNVDPDRIALLGDSAGAYLCACAATTHLSDRFNVGDHLEQSSEIIGAIDLYGLSDPIKVNGGFMYSPDAVKFNPINYVDKNSAPMLLMHGTNDQIVSPEQTDLLFQALRAAGVDSERYLIPGADHADEYWVQDAVFDVIVNWLARHAKR